MLLNLKDRLQFTKVNKTNAGLLGWCNQLLNDKTALTIGLTTCTLGILFNRLIHFELASIPVTDFMAGLFLGLSLVMNLKYLVSRRAVTRKN